MKKWKLLAERLEHVRQMKGYRDNLKAFLKKLGNPTSYAAARNYHTVTSNPRFRRDAPAFYLESVVRAFPDISAEWMLTGEGEPTILRRLAIGPGEDAESDDLEGMDLARWGAIFSVFDAVNDALAAEMGTLEPSSPAYAAMRAYLHDYIEHMDQRSPRESPRTKSDFRKILRTRFSASKAAAESEERGTHGLAVLYSEIGLRYLSDFDKPRASKKRG